MKRVAFILVVLLLFQLVMPTIGNEVYGQSMELETIEPNSIIIEEVEEDEQSLELYESWEESDAIEEIETEKVTEEEEAEVEVEEPGEVIEDPAGSVADEEAVQEEESKPEDENEIVETETANGEDATDESLEKSDGQEEILEPVEEAEADEDLISGDNPELEEPVELEELLPTNEIPEIILKMYNGNRTPNNNTIFPWFKVENISPEAIDLEKLKIRYYYTIGGEKPQIFYSDWSTLGSDNITGQFVKMEQPWEGANYYLEIGFQGSAGQLTAGNPVEIQTRIAKEGWENYLQTDDYSFNETATTYEEWHRVTVHYDDSLIWGSLGNEVEPEPIPTEPELTLKMYNDNRMETSNTIFIRYQLENTGQLPVNLKDVKIQYFYTIDGEMPQNYFPDWSNIGAANVIGEFIRLEEPLIGADHLLQVAFKESAGILEPGEKIELHSRIGKTDWSNFNQSNDYSFNPDAQDYVSWDKVLLLLNGEIIWGEGSAVLPPPEEPGEPQQPIKVQMYNGNRTENNNTLFPWYRIYNTGTKTIDLADVRVRYFFTSNGEKPLKYFVDWSDVGASNIIGTFSQFHRPRPGGDHYFEIGFREGAGTLAPGEYVEVHTRIAKADWESFIQIDDFSFNKSASSFIDWTKVNGYYQGYFVWGEADFFDIPDGLSAEATETTVDLQWEPVESASLYEVEADGQIYFVGEETSYLDTDCLPGTVHTYRVRAKTPTVTGNWSEPLEIYTIPGIPQNLQAHSTSQSVHLNWDPVEGALAYEVEIYGTPIEVGPEPAYIHTDLNPNTQTTYRVRAKNESGTGQWSTVIAQSTLPSIPTGLRGQATAHSGRISWNPTAGAVTYDVEVDGQVVEGVRETNYDHLGLAPNSLHIYRVKAKNHLGESQWSEAITVQILPEIPVNLRGTASQDEIIISWDPVEGATGYDIQADGVVIDNGEAISYTHGALQSDSKHTYRVRAKNENIVGEWSEAITPSTLLNGEISLSATTSSTQITVAWNMVSGALRYDIEVDGEIFDNGLSTVYVHKNLIPNTTHTYRVRALSQGGFSQWSNEITAATIFGTPQNIRTNADSATIVLTWDMVAGATGYDVFVDGQIIDNGMKTSFVHTDLEPYSWHVYRVRAKGTDMVGQWSEAVTEATLIGTPGNLKAEASFNQIELQWDSVAHATYYEIEVNNEIIDTTSSNEFIHENLKANQRYIYRVRAILEDDRPEWSSISTWSDSLKVNTLSGPPTNLKAEATTTGITLTWDAPEGALLYDVEVDGEIIEGISEAKYIAQGLKPNTYHYFRVRVRYEEGFSQWSQQLDKNTIPELTIQVAKDNLFHFVVVAPPKEGKKSFTIVVTYDSEAVAVMDLSANTPQVVTEAGPIPGTQITVTELLPGKIVYQVDGAVKTTVNSIQFLSKTNEFSKITYVIE